MEEECGGARASLKRLAAAVDRFAAQLQCAICLSTYANPASLPCNHCFCEECIHRALELKAECPMCKAPAKKRKLRYDSMIQQLLRAAEMLNAPAETDADVDDGKQESSTEDDALLLEEKPKSSKPSMSNGTSAERSTVAENLDSKKNDHAHISTKAAKWPSAVHKATNGSASTHRQQQLESAINGALVGEILSESTTSASNNESDQAKDTLRSVRPARRKNTGSVPASTSTSTVNPTADSPSLTSAAQVQCKEKSTAATEITTTATGAEQSESQPAVSQQHPLNGPFSKGQSVEVTNRTWSGFNKPGGAARIAKVNADGTYNVKYIIEARTESNVHDFFIHKPSDELEADVTPGRAVKQRQRRSTKYTAGETPSSEEQTPTLSASGRSKTSSKASGKRKRSEMVFLCSGYNEKGAREIEKWSETLNAEIVGSWTNQVTHLIVKCVISEQEGGGDDDEEKLDIVTTADRSGGTSGKRELFSDARNVTRWVKIRSMKYLKALVGGRWIVSEEWLQACAAHGGHVSEADFEADGHLKGRNIDDAVRRSRKRRQENLQTSPAGSDPALIGTKLFEDFCFHLVGDFLPPMPPQSELDMLLSIGGGKRIRTLCDITNEMAKEENAHRELVIVSDRINPVGLRDVSKNLRSLPQVKALLSVAIVNYQWVLNSISEAKLRPLK